MPVITLDKPYELKWTRRAQARVESLERPPTFSDLGRKSRRPFYALCVFVWASITERAHRFNEPEDVAEFLEKPEQIIAATKAIGLMVEEAFPSDPKGKEIAGSNAERKISKRGHSASSTSDSAQP